jgi:hypothetical protein
MNQRHSSRAIIDFLTEQLSSPHGVWSEGRYLLAGLKGVPSQSVGGAQGWRYGLTEVTFFVIGLLGR